MTNTPTDSRDEPMSAEEQRTVRHIKDNPELWNVIVGLMDKAHQNGYTEGHKHGFREGYALALEDIAAHLDNWSENNLAAQVRCTPIKEQP